MRITDNYSPTHCSDSVFSFVECRVCVFLLCVSVISGGGGAALAAGPASAQIRRFAVLISERDPHRKNEHATQCAPRLSGQTVTASNPFCKPTKASAGHA